MLTDTSVIRYFVNVNKISYGYSPETRILYLYELSKQYIIDYSIFEAYNTSYEDIMSDFIEISYEDKHVFKGMVYKLNKNYSISFVQDNIETTDLITRLNGNLYLELNNIQDYCKLKLRLK